MRRPVYLDYQASTPLDPCVRDVMQPLLEEGFGNPHSEHAHGWSAADAVEQAAATVATLIGAAPGEIIFTSVRPKPTTSRFRASREAPAGAVIIWSSAQPSISAC